MKVMLCQSVPNLGEIGATVNVAAGYARNFLFPRKLAVQIDSVSAQQIAHETRIIRKREEEHRAAMHGVAGEMAKLQIEIPARAGTEGKLFGSVTTANIAAALKDLGHEVDRRNIKLEAPIKSLGSYSVPIRLATDVEASITVQVIAEAEEAAPEPAAEPVAVEAAEDAEAEAGERKSSAPPVFPGIDPEGE